MNHSLEQLNEMMCPGFVSTPERPTVDFTQAVLLYLSQVERWRESSSEPKDETP